jgi:hypothetical protein
VSASVGYVAIVSVSKAGAIVALISPLRLSNHTASRLRTFSVSHPLANAIDAVPSLDCRALQFEVRLNPPAAIVCVASWTSHGASSISGLKPETVTGISGSNSRPRVRACNARLRAEQPVTSPAHGPAHDASGSTPARICAAIGEYDPVRTAA